ncbi:MAG: hypothetical protein QOG97_3320 [Acidimicrobiaceae bacterium]|nr:hypothetical protein [Acidimicrobiaceae bacterium]
MTSRRTDLRERWPLGRTAALASETTGRCRGRVATFGGRHPEPAAGGGGEPHLRAGGSRPRLGAHRALGPGRFDTGIARFRASLGGCCRTPPETLERPRLSRQPLTGFEDHHLKSPPVVMRPHQIPSYRPRSASQRHHEGGNQPSFDRRVRSAPSLRDTPPGSPACSLDGMVRRPDRHQRERWHHPHAKPDSRPGGAAWSPAELADLGLHLLGVTQVGPDQPEVPTTDFR